MTTNRLEAFSDGVLAIIITIMVLELKAPHDVTLEALVPELPVFASYLFSFIYLGIYWNNHHHLFQVTEKVNGKILWANLHLLFWLSLIPFTTSWFGEHPLENVPVFLYGFNLLMSAIAYYILQTAILKHHGKDFILKKAVGKDFKGKISMLLYIIGIGVSFFSTWIAIGCYIAVAVIWLIPDKRIEENID
ncbi:putative membrane protein [Ulvibacter sp. MAR_2010_11]|uniref:TMEM175 family protein n=1 Tax=Ulvibacter sp. MAR_2010_11 TaxID=1250229 RepID=UPI000C2C3071|nr:TMEM175 family protein [Ulvibacter sp. MAR_2010_11]PKA84288.1 putative membrane protein [Ulvibacter sp. MAR_2010_11]